MQTLRTPTGVYTLSPSRDSGAFAAQLAKCTGKHKPAKVKADRRRYPAFKVGMSTADYVRAYEMVNGGFFVPGFFDHAALNSEPCTLYSGEDTHETLTDAELAMLESPPTLDAAPDVPMPPVMPPRPSVPIHAAQYRKTGPALRVPAGDPRMVIPARFAPVYVLQSMGV